MSEALKSKPLWIVALALLVTLSAGHLEEEWQQEIDHQFHQARMERRSKLITAPAQARAASGTWLSVTATLPSHEQSTQRLEALILSAKKQGLIQERAEFSAERTADLGLHERKLHQRLSGSYLAVRQHVQSALAADPALSLDRVVLTRKSVESAEVSAELTWSAASADHEAEGAAP